ncbi:MAG: AI-2E family transporter, partial [Veillonella sp.]|nr:AI-2E family transporter [Veillonella sp.]
MKRFKYYKPLIGAIILAGVMIMMALRISDIANAIDAIITAFVPLIVGACMA